MSTDNPAPVVPPRTREKYVHLYMPLITAALILKTGQIISKLANPNNERPQDILLFTALSALPTYYVGSYTYPTDLPAATPEECVRFTRKHDAYRALVLATYGRLFGTPFNLQFLIADFVLSYVAGFVIGERPVGTQQRRSEFLAALLWVLGSHVVGLYVPPSMPTLWFLATAVDRTLWRAAYLALVDDVVSTLSRPDVRTWRGKATVVAAQAMTISALVWVVLTWIRMWNKASAWSSKAV
ncbi:hypothetical protein CC86DRAFT_375641 [Ophiobolus disseminans]|uniref:Uncharacterized protein n=1 Tax=Ophiobolus disseminans TaxID=1469910 RepID=A0A6A6ZDK5_9PLEO|nr:hypothetical protein CC86DRAFT_375641 [Ophiobolus disseminans]